MHQYCHCIMESGRTVKRVETDPLVIGLTKPEQACVMNILAGGIAAQDDAGALVLCHVQAVTAMDDHSSERLHHIPDGTCCLPVLQMMHQMPWRKPRLRYFICRLQYQAVMRALPMRCLLLDTAASSVTEPVSAVIFRYSRDPQTKSPGAP